MNKEGELIISPEDFFVKKVKDSRKNNELKRTRDWTKIFIK